MTVSLEHASADVRLRTGNTITLAQLRSIIRKNGFTSKDATVTAVGRIVERNGAPAFQISGIDLVLMLAADPQAPAVLDRARERLARKDQSDVQLTGKVEAGGTDAAVGTMRVTAMGAP